MKCVWGFDHYLTEMNEWNGEIVSKNCVHLGCCQDFSLETWRMLMVTAVKPVVIFMIIIIIICYFWSHTSLGPFWIGSDFSSGVILWVQVNLKRYVDASLVVPLQPDNQWGGAQWPAIIKTFFCWTFVGLKTWGIQFGSGMCGRARTAVESFVSAGTVSTWFVSDFIFQRLFGKEKNNSVEIKLCHWAWFQSPVGHNATLHVEVNDVQSLYHCRSCNCCIQRAQALLSCFCGAQCFSSMRFFFFCLFVFVFPLILTFVLEPTSYCRNSTMSKLCTAVLKFEPSL